jgi:hypothetical protein
MVNEERILLLIFHGDDEKKEILNQDQKGKREQKSKLAK